jgi:hypothetical protein
LGSVETTTEGYVLLFFFFFFFCFIVEWNDLFFSSPFLQREIGAEGGLPLVFLFF